ncbi:hypothetical protein AC519_5469 [Pseudomonas savastanoi]|nr:hypothetical protein AC519_5469 [Pseudomonas savastanoi]RML17629.1 hypothetical protein ALR00_02639 [Pseudomonas savastanoi pv. retacarpa]RMR71584.1 hypothetical protein ALP81_102938 [Pseudomonas savastanoi pv. fraxini]
MPSTHAASFDFKQITLFAEWIFDLPLTRGKLIGASQGGLSVSAQARSDRVQSGALARH